MIEFTIETEIERPSGEVFDYAFDPANLTAWQSTLISAVVEGGDPVRIGTRLHEVHRGPGGKEIPNVVEVAELEPGRKFALRMIEGVFPLHVGMEFEPSGNDGTLVRFLAEGHPTGAMRLAEPILGRAIKRQFEDYCEALKRVLEAEKQPA